MELDTKANTNRMRVITSKIIPKLALPRPNSHKGENGRLLVVAGSEKYHGSLLYAIKAAAKIVDLVYVLTTAENRGLVRKLKEKTAGFILVDDLYPLSISPLSRGRKVGMDSVLIGPGMGESKRTYNFVRAVLKSKIKAVLDADALNVLDAKLLRLLGPQHILTPHKGELSKLYEKLTNVKSLYKLVKKLGCTVVLKGKVDLVATPSPLPPPLTPPRAGGEWSRQGERKVLISRNYTGNEGMTKGGTGDVLAGLIAAFFCRNDAFTSAAAGAYINGKAGDELYKKAGPFFDAEDLIQQIPTTLWNLLKTRNSKSEIRNKFK